MVRAKCRCESKTETEVTLRPVTSGSAENESFFKYTPYGEITLGVVNEAALAQFEQGKEYYLDFTPAN